MRVAVPGVQVGVDDAGPLPRGTREHVEALAGADQGPGLVGFLAEKGGHGGPSGCQTRRG